ncbi:MAG: OmpA domain-containing protein [Chloroflexi bacterium CSP1-4]|nr:MAG: OmpA domain-containing protein [Chloroflexi bacterium CSP1-4]
MASQAAGRTGRSRAAARGVLMSLVIAASGLLAGAASAAPVTVGYRDFSYAGTTAPTGQKPQSKLWFNDGIWWGNLFHSASKTYHIYRLDWATQTWSDTGTRVDTRAKAWSDAKWDGSHLYVASAVFSASQSASAKVWRFSYDSVTMAYSLDSGFPVTVSSGGVEAVVLETDTAGVAWVTFTQANKVWVTHSVGAAQTTWVAPYVLPLPGADTLTSDDISSIVAFDGQIGVMWSNQNPNDWAMYWATHVDGAGDSAADWVANTAVKQPEYADDHLNLKQLTADATGRVYAVTKTSLNNGGAPLTLLLVLKPNGTWERHTIGTVADDHTRAILLIDTDNRMLYVFAASPCCSGGIVYMKSTSIDNINFPSGKGTPFIQSATDTTINNPSSTKQNVNGASGLVVIAGDDHSRYYLHNAIDLGPPDTTPPDTIIDSGPSGIVSSTSATFTFHATETPSTFGCKVDNGPFSSCTSPATYTNLSTGSHTFRVRATDASGNTDATPAAQTWTIDTSVPDTTPPQVTLTAPAQGAQVGGTVNLTATASDDVAVDHVDFLVDGSLVGADASPPYAFAWDSTAAPEGPATVTARAVDSSLNTASDAHGVTVDHTAPDTIIDSGPSGTVASSSASFTFHATETGSSLACSLDGAPTSACTSPKTYTGLANGDHSFTVVATDPAGNQDPSAASWSWTVDTTGAPLFSDGFESGDFSVGGWTVVTGGDGTAVVQGATVKTGTYAARLAETASTGSVAYARKNLGASYADLSAAADIQVQLEGASGANVPIFRLYDASSVRLLTIYRQNATNGQIWASDGTNRFQSTGLLPLNAWGRFKVHVITAGSGASTVELWLDGSKVLTATTANLGTSGVRSVQIGNDTSKQTFALVADDVLVTQGP